MKVKYIGATDEQVLFGNCSDPRGVLIEGNIYNVTKEHPKSWHTKYEIDGFDGMKFNSVCFEKEL